MRPSGLEEQKPQWTQFPKEKQRPVLLALGRGGMFADKGQK